MPVGSTTFRSYMSSLTRTFDQRLWCKMWWRWSWELFMSTTGSDVAEALICRLVLGLKPLKRRMKTHKNWKDLRHKLTDLLSKKIIRRAVANSFRIQVQNRALELDDSSSVTSENPRNIKLKSCHLKTCSLRVESLPMKPLVPCGRCSRRWHPNCHDPPIHDVYWNTNEWRCTRCRKKLKTTMLPATFPNTSTSSTKSVLRCKVCQRVLPYLQPGAKELCKMHEIEDRHKQAQAARARLFAQIHAPARDVKKRKLCPDQLIDTYSNGDLRVTQRKREVEQAESASHSGLDYVQPLPRVLAFNQASVEDEIIDVSPFRPCPSVGTKRSESRVVDSIVQECTRNAERFVVVSPEYEPPPASEAEKIPKDSSSGAMLWANRLVVFL